MFRARSVVFDCDSTLSAIEGIEELAEPHQRDEIARLTEAAMRGEVPLEAVYGRRLAVVAPSRARVAALGRQYVEAMVDDAGSVVRTLRAEGLDVRLVSGGLLPAILTLAAALGVSAASVAAVDVRFGADGAYAGFDELSPLARAGGKLEILRSWSATLPRPVMFVGDGATDLEARPAVDRFVAYAGVIVRESVVAAADEVIRSRSLAPVLPMALGDVPPRDPAGRATFDHGVRLRSAHARDALSKS